MVENSRIVAYVAAAAFLSSLLSVSGAVEFTLGSSKYTASGVFPTKAYSSYWNNPSSTTEQPNPVIYDPILDITYPKELTDPKNLPAGNFNETTPIPSPATYEQIYAQGFAQLSSINASAINDTCAQCKMMLEVAKFVSLAAPSYGTNVSIDMCNFYKSESTPETCEKNYGQYSQGPFLTQVWAAMDVAGLDGELFCQNFYSACPLPPTTPLNISEWFTPKPAHLPPPKKASGQLLKVLHLSDFHIDPRYAIGAEANCSDYLCCRSDQFNSASRNQPLSPAPKYGAYKCDTPQDLALAVLEAIPVLTGTEESGFDFSIFTGDLVPHDQNFELSRAYTLEIETMIFELWKRELKSGPIYPTQGNHDEFEEAFDAPHTLAYPLNEEFEWNYGHLSSLWQHEGWIDSEAAVMARAMYGAYMVMARPGLRVMSINSDFFYTANIFNYINASNPDNSGMFRFLIQELQEAEDAGDRAWIIWHHPPGWTAGQAMLNPTDLLYQIIDRYSHVIAGVFFGHTHEDMNEIWYANNGSTISAETAVVNGWDVPSVTPLSNLNSGFRMYLVDSGNFEIYEAFTYYADVNSFAALDNETKHGPVYQLEYSTREAYNTFGWPDDAPLNATFWHYVTEAMEQNGTMVEMFQTYQSKSSVKTPPCTSTECQQSKVCYIRSGSVSLSIQNCQNQNFGSTQG